MTNPETDQPDLAYVDIAESDWNGLDGKTGPFVDWRFLASAVQAGCTGGDSGWHPLPLIERHNGQTVCAAPLWLKHHSHGEFVFDFAWAEVSNEAGMPWYPKLLVAAPFTPVSGPRLLGSERDPDAALRLIERIESRVESDDLWSASVNFCSPSDAAVLHTAGWLERFDWQYHWHNPGYADFDDFLAGLKHKPRKNIRAERRRVHEAGWQFRWRDGSALTASELDLLDRCYRSTFALYGNWPSLNREFFALNARHFGARFLACIATLDGQDLACAIFWRDDTRLYGRYWGSLIESRDLHFEVCYYQGIELAIRCGLRWFEPGAQGEHKIRRGFLPVKTRSFHFIRHPDLRQGVRQWLAEEARFLDQRRVQLDQLDPFRSRP